MREALRSGYLYAATTPLSNFWSLGSLKIGIYVLVSSLSIPEPLFSFKLTPYPKVSVTFHGRRSLSARILKTSLKPVGTVAPLIAMDETRYTAETRLMEILKETSRTLNVSLSNGNLQNGMSCSSYA